MAADHARARESRCTSSIFQCKEDLEPLRVVVGELRGRGICVCTTTKKRKVFSSGPPAAALSLMDPDQLRLKNECSWLHTITTRTFPQFLVMAGIDIPRFACSVTMTALTPPTRHIKYTLPRSDDLFPMLDFVKILNVSRRFVPMGWLKMMRRFDENSFRILFSSSNKF